MAARFWSRLGLGAAKAGCLRFRDKVLGSGFRDWDLGLRVLVFRD